MLEAINRMKVWELAGSHRYPEIQGLRKYLEVRIRKTVLKLRLQH